MRLDPVREKPHRVPVDRRPAQLARHRMRVPLASLRAFRWDRSNDRVLHRAHYDISAMRAFTMRLTSITGGALSSGNWIVPFELLYFLMSAPIARRTPAVSG